MMNAYLSRLNPTERRFVIGVAILFFIVINVFWVMPHFSDWRNLKNRIGTASSTLARYDSLIRQKPKIEAEINKLQSEGTYVPPEDQFTQFLRNIQSLAQQYHVNFTGSSRPNTTTNEFFLEQSQTISVVSGEKELVDFLYALGSGTSLIRVRALSIRPDSAHQQLNTSMTLVCSYQKQRRSPPPATAAPTPAVKSTARQAPNASKQEIKPTPTPLPRQAPVKPTPTKK
jgi:hypothetical protein